MRLINLQIFIAGSLENNFASDLSGSVTWIYCSCEARVPVTRKLAFALQRLHEAPVCSVEGLAKMLMKTKPTVSVPYLSLICAVLLTVLLFAGTMHAQDTAASRKIRAKVVPTYPELAR